VANVVVPEVAGGPAEAPRAPLRMFEFRSGFWLNLHHELYGLSAGRAVEAAAGRHPPPGRTTMVDFVSTVDEARLSPGETAVWSEAVEYYQAHVLGPDAHGEPGMRSDGPQQGLSARVEASSDGERVLADMASVVMRAAPVFAAHGWPARRHENQVWIAEAAPDVRKLGEEIAGELSRAYDMPWPDEPVRVDVVGYAGTAGTYVTLDPPHVRVAASDPRNTGLPGLEVVFHEASHGLVEKLRDGLAEACERHGKRGPPDLWHAMVFFTTGDVLARRLDGYVPYADRCELYDADWKSVRGVLAAHWQPFLRGAGTWEGAVDAVAAAL